MPSDAWLSLTELALLALTLLATLAMAAYVAWQTQHHFALERSQEFIQRFNNPEMIEVRHRIDRWVESGQPVWEMLEQARVEAASQVGTGPASAVRTDCLMMTNFFQEMGAAMRFKMLDRKYTWGVFGRLVPQYWNALRPYVYQIRYTRHRKTLLEDFEWMSREMIKIDQRRGLKTERSDRGEEQSAFLFGYGSLFSPASIERTAGRPYEKAELMMAWLDGYERGWTVFDHVSFAGDTSTTPTVFYNVAPEPGAACNGLLIPVQADNLAAFDDRERKYDRVDVTDCVTPRPPGRVYTYVGRPASTRLPADAVIPGDYETLVQDALEAWGDPLQRDFADSTLPSKLPRKAGPYTFQ